MALESVDEGERVGFLATREAAHVESAYHAPRKVSDKGRLVRAADRERLEARVLDRARGTSPLPNIGRGASYRGLVRRGIRVIAGLSLDEDLGTQLVLCAGTLIQ
jgi:hypothetical protein